MGQRKRAKRRVATIPMEMNSQSDIVMNYYNKYCFYLPFFINIILFYFYRIVGSHLKGIKNKFRTDPAQVLKSNPFLHSLLSTNSNKLADDDINMLAMELFLGIFLHSYLGLKLEDYKNVLRPSLTSLSTTLFRRN